MKTEPATNCFHTGTQTVGEKLMSFLRQPLFNFQISKPAKPTAKEKSEPPLAVKPVVHRKTPEPKRAASNKPSRRPTVTHNTLPRRNTAVGTFTSVRNKDEFEKILFVLRACDKCGGRTFTEVLHVERTENGSRLIATDGKRMHVAKIKTMIKPGDYKPVVTQDVIRMGKPLSGVQFPNWKRVVPVNTLHRGCINPGTAAVGEGNPVYRSFVRQTGEQVNPKYLEDLTKKPWTVYSQREKRKALLLKERGAKTETYAVIMPLAA